MSTNGLYTSLHTDFIHHYTPGDLNHMLKQFPRSLPALSVCNLE